MPFHYRCTPHTWAYEHTRRHFVYPFISQFSLLPLTLAKLDIGKMVANMMLKKAKPAELKRIKHCRCKKSMCICGCFCVRANVKCVVACLCAGTPANVQRLTSYSKTSTAPKLNTHFQCRTAAITCTIGMIEWVSCQTHALSMGACVLGL